MVLSIQRPANFGQGELSAASNQLLNLLSKSEQKKLLAQAEFRVISPKTVLCSPSGSLEKIYFPLQGIISLVNISEEGLVAETASISNEGMIGITPFLGRSLASGLMMPSSNLAITQTKLTTIAIPLTKIQPELSWVIELQPVILRYSQALLAQVAQNVFCSCHHTLSQRLARWLTFYSNRLQTTELLLTQETLAELMGVRRSSLSMVAINFRRRNLIDYNRGKIMLLNPEVLNQVSCRCNSDISHIYFQLLNHNQK